ncbi:MAG: hypothetical protein GC162_19385 [Planctomycetes bacterium]|nr:hypothetical protein [Planctomycetota bacterium]
MTRIPAGILALLTLTLALSPGGCEVGSFVATNVLPRPKIPAVFELPKQSTVVMVDDPHRLIPNATLAPVIAANIGADLKKNEVVSEVIAPNLIEDLRVNEQNFSNWPIDKIGKQVGAKQVIYIMVEGFDLTESQAIYRPTAAVRVKVIDVETGRRLFPQGDNLGYPVSVQKYYKNMQGATDGTDLVLARGLAQRVAEDVGKLFYEHKEREVGSGFED